MSETGFYALIAMVFLLAIRNDILLRIILRRINHLKESMDIEKIKEFNDSDGFFSYTIKLCDLTKWKYSHFYKD